MRDVLLFATDLLQSGRAGVALVAPGVGNAKAREAVLKAIELDDTRSETRSVLAGIKRLDFDWAGSEAEYKRAIELDPNYASARAGYSWLLAELRRPQEARMQIERPSSWTHSILASGTCMPRYCWPTASRTKRWRSFVRFSRPHRVMCLRTSGFGTSFTIWLRRGGGERDLVSRHACLRYSQRRAAIPGSCKTNESAEMSRTAR